MLLEFGVNNYLSFNNNAILSMISSGDRELQNHKIGIEKTEKSNFYVNKLAALFGANASGKSNMLDSFKAMRKLVLSHGLGTSKILEKRSLPHRYFLLDELSKEKPSSFDVVIYVSETVFRYTFSFFEDRFSHEKLSIIKDNNEEVVFKRRNLDVHFYNGFDKPTFRNAAKKFIADKLLMLTILGELKENPFQSVLQFFKTIRTESDPDDFIPMVYDLTESENLKHIIKLLQFADTGLYDIVRNENDDIDTFPDELREMLLKVKDSISKNPDVSIEGKQVELIFKHQSLQNNNKYIADFSLHNESRGTVKFIVMLFQMLETIKEDGIFIVDEIESGLHPMLVAWLVGFFTSIQHTRAQMVFSSHCPFLFDKDIVRRDELWLIEKDETGASEITSAASYRPRGDGNLSKQYLEGRYGGIPILQHAYLKECYDAISEEIFVIKKRKDSQNGK